MNANTRNAILAIIATDATITPEQSAAALRALDGVQERPVGRVLRAGEVAKMFRVTTRSVRAWREAGLLKAVRGAGSKTLGYTEESALALLAGG